LDGFHVFKNTRLLFKHTVPHIGLLLSVIKRHLIAILVGEYSNPILGISKFVNRGLAAAMLDCVVHSLPPLK
jgi:hypothetical protein